MIGVQHTNIELLESEQRIAKFLAKYKLQQCKVQNYQSHVVGKDSQEVIDLESIGSELAAAKLLNVWPDLDHSIAEVHDFYYNGYTVDVKVTKYPNGRLILAPYKKDEKSCDYYILMVGKFPKYTFIGAASKKELIDEKNLGSLGYNKIYMLPQNKLKSFKEFVDETKTRT